MQNPSPGCSLTIALWAQLPARTILLLSTAEQYSFNSGFSMSFSDKLKIESYIASTYISHSGPSLEPTEWTHFAFTYRVNTMGALHVALYINFETVNAEVSYFPAENKFVPKPFMGSGISEGQASGYGVIDELLIFPEYLSASQIAQMKYSTA